MMDDLISRTALRNALYDADAVTMEGVKIINQFPAANTTIVHARWVMDDYTHQYRCSNCNRVQPYDACDCGDHNNPIYDYWDCNFCPECGAIIDLESEGKDE